MFNRREILAAMASVFVAGKKAHALINQEEADEREDSSESYSSSSGSSSFPVMNSGQFSSTIRTTLPYRNGDKISWDGINWEPYKEI